MTAYRHRESEEIVAKRHLQILKTDFRWGLTTAAHRQEHFELRSDLRALGKSAGVLCHGRAFRFGRGPGIDVVPISSSSLPTPIPRSLRQPSHLGSSGKTSGQSPGNWLQVTVQYSPTVSQ